MKYFYYPILMWMFEEIQCTQKYINIQRNKKNNAHKDGFRFFWKHNITILQGQYLRFENRKFIDGYIS